MRILYFIAVLTFPACEMNVVSLPCIFGEWKTEQLYTLDGRTTDSVRLNSAILITPGLKIDFQKSDKALFYLPQTKTVNFKYNDKGFRFYNDSEEVWAKDISANNDTMTMHLNGNRLVFIRYLPEPSAQ